MSHEVHPSPRSRGCAHHRVPAPRRAGGRRSGRHHPGRSQTGSRTAPHHRVRGGRGHLDVPRRLSGRAHDRLRPAWRSLHGADRRRRRQRPAWRPRLGPHAPLLAGWRQDRIHQRSRRHDESLDRRRRRLRPEAVQQSAHRSPPVPLLDARRADHGAEGGRAVDVLSRGRKRLQGRHRGVDSGTRRLAGRALSLLQHLGTGGGRAIVLQPPALRSHDRRDDSARVGRASPDLARRAPDGLRAPPGSPGGAASPGSRDRDGPPARLPDHADRGARQPGRASWIRFHSRRHERGHHDRREDQAGGRAEWRRAGHSLPGQGFTGGRRADPDAHASTRRRPRGQGPALPLDLAGRLEDGLQRAGEALHNGSSGRHPAASNRRRRAGIHASLLARWPLYRVRHLDRPRVWACQGDPRVRRSHAHAVGLSRPLLEPRLVE